MDILVSLNTASLQSTSLWELLTRQPAGPDCPLGLRGRAYLGVPPPYNHMPSPCPAQTGIFTLLIKGPCMCFSHCVVLKWQKPSTPWCGFLLHGPTDSVPAFLAQCSLTVLPWMLSVRASSLPVSYLAQAPGELTKSSSLFFASK